MNEYTIKDLDKAIPNWRKSIIGDWNKAVVLELMKLQEDNINIKK
jgi:hypothetical protein